MLLEHPMIVQKIQELSIATQIITDKSIIGEKQSIDELVELRKKVKTLQDSSASAVEDLYKLNMDISKLTEEKRSFINEVDTLNRINRELTKQNSSLENENKCLIQEIKEYEDRFQIFEQYKLLSNETRNSLRGIFKDDSFEQFIACGSQRDNIEAFWDLLKHQVLNNNITENFEDLTRLQAYFLNLYNATSDRPVYQSQSVMIGEKFDVSLHIRTSEGKASGNIGKIYLLGYRNIVTQTLVRKSLVRVD